MWCGSGDLLAHRYRLDERVGTGGYGEVWRGTDLALKRAVAVRLLPAACTHHPEKLTRFRKETGHAGALAHGNITRVYDYGEPAPPQPPYLVTEFVDGPSLAQVLTRGPLDPAEAMRIVGQAAGGLYAAHQAGLVHRDIKPGNLLLRRDGTVKITDFGIVYVAGSTPVTATGALMGTPGYIAPERLGGTPASPASDMYSLGMVCYECLVGTGPFAAIGLDGMLASRDDPLPPLPASVPAGVAALVTELTAKDPAARPGSSEASRQAGLLRALLTDGATLAPAQGRSREPVAVLPPAEQEPAAPPGPEPGHPRPRRRGRLGWRALVAVMSASLLVMLGVIMGTVRGSIISPRPAAVPSSIATPKPLTGSRALSPARGPAGHPGQPGQNQAQYLANRGHHGRDHRQGRGHGLATTIGQGRRSGHGQNKPVRLTSNLHRRNHPPPGPLPGLIIPRDNPERAGPVTH
jgi:serine/threonine protein kinase